MTYLSRLSSLCACCLCGLLAAVLCGCKENKSEITVTRPEWNSLTYPLGMPAYYVSINSKELTGRLSLRIDAYRNGELTGSTTSQIRHFLELRPVEADIAIYFDKNESAVTGSTVIALGKQRDQIGTSSFKLNLPSINSTGGWLYTLEPSVNPDGITPLFAIAYGANSYPGSAPTVEYLIENYSLNNDKGVTVLAFSLETSKEITEFKQATGSPAAKND